MMVKFDYFNAKGISNKMKAKEGFFLTEFCCICKIFFAASQKNYFLYCILAQEKFSKIFFCHLKKLLCKTQQWILIFPLNKSSPFHLKFCFWHSWSSSD